MRPIRLALVVLVAGIVPLVAPTAAEAQPTPSAANDALGLFASEVVSIDVPADPGDRFTVVVPIDGLLRQIALERRTVRGPDFQLLVQDATGALVAEDPGAVMTLSGEILGEKGSHVAGGLLDEGVVLSVELGSGERFWVEPLAGRVAGAGAEHHAVYLAGDSVSAGDCGGGIPAQFSGPLGLGSTPCGNDHCLAQLACDADFEFYNFAGGSFLRTQTWIEVTIHLVNCVFEREASVTHQITGIVVRASEPDPYTSTNEDFLLAQVGAEWAAGTHATIPRDLVHLFTGKDVDGTTIGLAWVGGLCSPTNGFAFSQWIGMSMEQVSDLTVHELGHNWNADHCTCATPPYTMNPGITGANRFHPTLSAPEIIAYRETSPCLSGAADNDECDTAWEVCPGTITSSTTHATASTPIGCGSNANLDTWYLYRPAVGGIATVHTNGSAIDTVLAIWNGCGSFATQLACDDSSGVGTASQVTWNVIAGETYLIQVAGANNTTGSFNLTIVGPPCAIPFHDQCPDAWNIGPGEFRGTTDGATDDGDASCGGSISPDVWFRYSPITGGIAVVDTCDSGFDTVLSVVLGCPGSGEAEIACNDDAVNGCASFGSYQSRVEFVVTGGEEYWIRLAGYLGARGTYRLRLSGPQSANDACSVALPIDLGTSIHSLVGATPGSIDPGCGSSLPSPDAYFLYTAPANGLLVVSSCGTNDFYGVDTGMDTVLSIHTTCSGSSGGVLDCDDDAPEAVCAGLDEGENRDSQVAYEVTAGQTVRIRAACFGGSAPGPLVLNLALVPENDACVDMLSVGQGVFYGDLTYATVDGTASCTPVTGPDLWYRYTAPVDGLLIVTTCGTHDLFGVDTGTDTTLALFNSACTGFVSEFDCNANWNTGASVPGGCAGGSDQGLPRDAVVSRTVNAGQSTRIRVAATSGTPPGPFLLKIDLVPENDLCSTAQPIGVGTYSGYFGGATDQGVGIVSCLPVNLTTQRDLWFSFTAPDEGTLYVNTCGTHDLGGVDMGVDTNLQILSNNCSGFIGLFDCNDTWDSSTDPFACAGTDDGNLHDAATRVTMGAGTSVKIRLSQTVALAPPYPAAGYYNLNVNFVVGPPEPNFRRGDANADGANNIADAVTMLSALFPSGPPPTIPCADAGDANDDGSFNIGDPIALLGSLFGSPTVPLPPPNVCGSDPTSADGVDCLSYPPCP